MPAAWFIGPLGFLICSFLIYWSGFETVWKLGICLVIGYVLIGVFMAFDPQRPPLDWKSAQWLPFYLVGMGIISWQGQYGPDNTFRIPFGLDFVVVAVFTLVIYYWAVAVSLPREEMLRLIAMQSERMADVPDTPRH